MTGEFTIHVIDDAVQAAFRRLIARGNDLTPLMAEVAEHLVESTQKRFATSTGPDGVPWPALRDGSGRKPLVASGAMRDQIFPSHGSTWAQITATARQARWHQEGTDPYVILPKGRALHWPGAKHPVGKVNHPGLPARPFMGVSAEDVQAVLAMAQAYLDDGAEG